MLYETELGDVAPLSQHEKWLTFAVSTRTRLSELLMMMIKSLYVRRPTWNWQHSDIQCH